MRTNATNSKDGRQHWQGNQTAISISYAHVLASCEHSQRFGIYWMFVEFGARTRPRMPAEIQKIKKRKIKKKLPQKLRNAIQIWLYGTQPVPHLQLANCEHLGLSSNNIEKVTGLKALKKLKVLSLGRNCLKKFDGIGTLDWVSF